VSSLAKPKNKYDVYQCCSSNPVIDRHSPRITTSIHSNVSNKNIFKAPITEVSVPQLQHDNGGRKTPPLASILFFLN
jgi:hypothetical protein